MNSGQFQPGHEKIPGSGRQKGTSNKPRFAISHHLATVMEHEIQDVGDYLQDLKTKQPERYFATILKLLPYTIPRGGMDAIDAQGIKSDRQRRREEIMQEAHEELQRVRAQRAARDKERDEAAKE